jgi:hypothetical protein
LRIQKQPGISNAGVCRNRPTQENRLHENLDTTEAGHLHIEFSGTEDLLTKLFELSQAAANDFDRFRAASEPAARRSA